MRAARAARTAFSAEPFPLHWRAVAGERVKLEVVRAEPPRLGRVPAPAQAGLRSGRPLRRATTPVAIAVGERELRAALTTPAGQPRRARRRPSDSGREHSAILKDYQRDPVRGTIAHIDLQEVRLDQPIQTAVMVTARRRGRAGREGGRRALAGRRRGQRRGAAARGAASPSRSTSRRWRSATRSAWPRSPRPRASRSSTTRTRP